MKMVSRFKYYAFETISGAVAGGVAFYWFGWRRYTNRMWTREFEGHRPYSDVDHKYLRKNQVLPLTRNQESEVI